MVGDGSTSWFGKSNRKGAVNTGHFCLHAADDVAVLAIDLETKLPELHRHSSSPSQSGRQCKTDSAIHDRFHF